MSGLPISIPELDIPFQFPSLEGRIAIITGGSSGIGFAAVQLFIANGAIVVLADLHSPPPSLEPSSSWSFCKTDVTSWASLSATFRSTFQKYNRIDIAIANAGIEEFPVEDIFEDRLDAKGDLEAPKYKVLNVNLIGTMNTVRLATHYFSRNPPINGITSQGHIVMNGSTASYFDDPLPVYDTAKHGLLGFMRALKNSAPKFGVSINMVAPWFTQTGFLDPKGRVLLESIGVPVNAALSVARAIAFLCEGDKSGRAIHVAGDKFRDFEGGYESIQKFLVGEEGFALLSKAKESGFFTSPSGW